jgi:FAD/FMN-containing dehydrogenase
MIDRRPAAIVQCLGASDVIHGINFAREHGIDLTVRGGGHSVAGKATCDGCLMLDLSNMRGVRVDTATRIAEAQPGATLGDFDRETHTFGVATTLGIVSRTGIAGLTLGGGIGWLNGKYGLACDNLVSLDVVTADGRCLSASPDENEDLFWGLRGGGGNFGVVTSFRYRLHPVHTVLAGMVIHPLSQGKQVLRFYDEFAGTAPDELSLAGAVLTGPDGQAIVAIAACFCGPLEAGEQALKPLRSFGPPLADMFGPMRYVDLQKMLDGAFEPRFNHYWKSSFLRSVSVETAETIVEYMIHKPSPNTVVTIQQLHGAAASIPVSATAFAHRAPLHDFGILSIWSNAGDSEKNLQWTREFHSAMEPFLEKGVYVNNLGEEGEDRVRAAYGENYNRLRTIKKKYDPGNFFHHNQNVKPFS